MNDGGYKVFVVEGKERETKLFDKIEKFFFSKKKVKFITLPAEQNIYMLWKRLRDDDYQTDIIEILREKIESVESLLAGIKRNQIDEVFLFFDYDGHQDNLPRDCSSEEVLEEMLKTFCDETDQGKLYISYPMIEAIRDWSWDKCNAFFKCILTFGEFIEYKKNSAENNPNTNIDHYTLEAWKNIFNVFVMRITCLFDQDQIPNRDFYIENVTPYNIYLKQKSKYIKNNRVFVLSVIPEFLLDYFPDNFWKSWIKSKKLHHSICKK